MNAFLKKHETEVKEILNRYPPDRKRSAVMPLLHLAQTDLGYIHRQAVVDIAEIVEITPTEVATIVGFYTLYHDHPEGRYRFQICTDLPCALRGADTFLRDLCRALKIKPGETTRDGLITVEEVKCLAACHRAPMFQVQSAAGIEYRENQTVDSAMAYVAELRGREGAV
jgi:NADH-quinone oxidoreductase E subunit